MERVAVESETLASVGYEGGTLELEFRDGPVYRYVDVPAAVHAQLMAADSKGRFFNARIRDRFRDVRI